MALKIRQRIVTVEVDGDKFEVMLPSQEEIAHYTDRLVSLTEEGFIDNSYEVFKELGSIYTRSPIEWYEEFDVGREIYFVMKDN